MNENKKQSCNYRNVHFHPVFWCKEDYQLIFIPIFSQGIILFINQAKGVVEGVCVELHPRLGRKGV